MIANPLDIFASDKQQTPDRNALCSSLPHKNEHTNHLFLIHQIRSDDYSNRAAQKAFSVWVVFYSAQILSDHIGKIAIAAFGHKFRLLFSSASKVG